MNAADIDSDTKSATMTKSKSSKTGKSNTELETNNGATDLESAARMKDATKPYEENGICVGVKAQSDKPTKCKTFLNPKMVICREFVLACLKVHCDLQDEGKLTKCLDAFGATGIGGLQWKKHMHERVEVTINEIQDESVANIKENVEKNGMQLEEQVIPPGFDVHNTLPGKPPSSAGIELFQSDANMLMHIRQFNFIHLDPYGSTVNYLDAAFRNIYNQGVLVITSTDVSSLYGKCPQVTQRSYGAYLQKCDYYKEAAARIVLLAIARAAARCNKGIHVLYTVAVEHFVQVAVRICRGASHADQTLTNVRGVLHCQMCEEYAILPGTHTVIEDTYDLLPCDCHKSNPGKTAIEIGPMWCGDLFDVTFVEKMKQAAQVLKLSDRLKNLLQGMLVEANCPLEFVDLCLHGIPLKVQTNEAEPPTESGNDESEKERCKLCYGKRKAQPSLEEEPKPKRQKRESRIPIDKMPFFYYDIHRRKIKGWDLPKAHKFVTVLHEEGYRASRTTFDPTAVRTNATLRQVKEVIFRRCAPTPKTT